MRRSNSDVLLNAQVARLEERRKELRLSMAALAERFAAALKAGGCVHTPASAKMRLDRVLNPRMRRPVSETTRAALAQALDWTIAEFEKAISETAAGQSAKVPSPAGERDGTTNARRSARQIAHCAAVQLETHQIARGVDLERDNLSKVYAATYRMFLHLRGLLEELPVAELSSDPATREIYAVLVRVLNESLRPHLTLWADRYDQWQKAYRRTPAGKHLTPQGVQAVFPERSKLGRDLRLAARQLQIDVARLKLASLVSRKTS